MLQLLKDTWNNEQFFFTIHTLSSLAKIPGQRQAGTFMIAYEASQEPEIVT